MCSKAARLHNKGYKLKSEKKLFHKTVSASLETCSHFNSENMPARSQEHDKPLLTSQRSLQLPSHNSWSNWKEAKATMSYLGLSVREEEQQETNHVPERPVAYSVSREPNPPRKRRGMGLSPQLLPASAMPAKADTNAASQAPTPEQPRQVLLTKYC